MGSLQEAFERAIGEAPYRALAELIASKLKAQGVQLSEKRLELLVDQLAHGDADSVRISQRWWDRRDITIEITDEETEALVARFERLADESLSDVVQDLGDSLADAVLATLRKTWRREATRQKRERHGFEKRLNRRWGDATDRLRMLLTIACESGEMASGDSADLEDRPVLRGILTRLHARSCQVTEEVITLLNAGLADGAMARWRTLHEIASVAMVLAEHGETLAERYAAHEVIESYRAAKDYRECSERLGYEPISEDEFAAVKVARDEALERYGPEFDSQYGWAASALGKKSPSLRDMQEAAGIDHLRAHYRMASHNVHANPKGVFFKLGLLDESDVLLAGRSNAGLADPGHSSAISLMQITSTLCALSPSIDAIVAMKIMQILTDEVGDLFDQANRQLIEDAG